MKITKEQYEQSLKELFEGAQANVVPQMKQSAFCLAVLDKHADLFLGLQLGLALVFEKPLVVLALDGTAVPPKVRMIADYVIEGRSMKDADVRRQVQEAISQILGKARGPVNRSSSRGTARAAQRKPSRMADKDLEKLERLTNQLRWREQEREAQRRAARRGAGKYKPRDSRNHYIAEAALVREPIENGRAEIWITYTGLREEALRIDSYAAVWGFDTMHAGSEDEPRTARDWIRANCWILYRGLILAAELWPEFERASRRRKVQLAERLLALLPEQPMGKKLGFEAMIGLLAGEV